jgi:hypothetical protein
MERMLRPGVIFRHEDSLGASCFITLALTSIAELFAF